MLTSYASWYFKDASWKHHDFGYTKGHTDAHRKEYDQLFLAAMKRDAKSHMLPIRLAAYLVSHTFYLAVRIGGRKSFFYCHRYMSLQEIRNEIVRINEADVAIMPDGLK